MKSNASKKDLIMLMIFFMHLPMYQAKPDFVSHSKSIITEFSKNKNIETEMKPGKLNNIADILFPLIQADAFRASPDISFNEKEIFKDVNKSDMQMLSDLIKDNQSFLVKKNFGLC